MKYSNHASMYRLLLFVLIIISSSSSLFTQEIVEKASNSFIKLWIEAEAGNIRSPMKVWYDENASGGSLLKYNQATTIWKVPLKMDI